MRRALAASNQGVELWREKAERAAAELEALFDDPSTVDHDFAPSVPLRPLASTAPSVTVELPDLERGLKAKVPGRGAACHLRWRLRCGDAPVARPPVPGAGDDAPPTHAASAFSSNGPDRSKAGVGASRPFGPAWIDTVS